MATTEFRFQGVNETGQPVQGTVFANNRRAAQQKATALAQKHRFSLKQLQERRSFLYKVRHQGTGKVITGEQKAYSQEDVQRALAKMGLEVLRVEKKLFTINRKPPQQDLIMFVRLSSNLLREKLPFDEVINLLVGDISSKSLKQVLRDLNADLKSGMEAKQAFLKHQHMLGKFTAYMLGIASQSGNMAEIYEATARFLERQSEFKKSVKSAMVTPAITMIILAAVMIWYVWYIFPQTAGLLDGLGMPMPPMTAATLKFSRWLDGNWMWVFGLFLAAAASFVFWARTTKGKFAIHRNLIRLPVIGGLLHKLNIEIYCRVFSVLYSGSGDNISVIRIAAEACGNSYMEHRIKTITVPMMVGQGAELVRAMEAADVFTPMAVARFRSGSETGSVRASAQQMADYYEKETSLKLKTTVESIQTAVALIITVAIIGLTLVSSEIALIQPSQQDMMNARQKPVAEQVPAP